MPSSTSPDRRPSRPGDEATRKAAPPRQPGDGGNGSGKASESGDPVQIRIRGLNKTFGPQHVLRGVDLDIERGKINIVIGGSGQGKSVLMKHLMGLLKPDWGRSWSTARTSSP